MTDLGTERYSTEFAQRVKDELPELAERVDSGSWEEVGDELAVAAFMACMQPRGWLLTPEFILEHLFDEDDQPRQDQLEELRQGALKALRCGELFDEYKRLRSA